jgi:hypothetical protein
MKEVVVPKFGTRGGGQGVSLRCCYGRNFQVIAPVDNQKNLVLHLPARGLDFWDPPTH